MFKRFLPKEDRFFTLFRQHADIVSEGIDQFESLLADYSRREELTALIKKTEERADDIAHKVFGLLNTVFVTPFDREDIRMLTNNLDDVMDMLEKAGTRMEIYNMPLPLDSVCEQTRILKRAFAKLSAAIGMLGDLKQKDAILKICIDVNSIENEGDLVLRSSLRLLFENPTDPFLVMKQREIFEHLEAAIDRCEDLANVIETILMKYA
jgi:predicted phosphate transport protein (TIGR00153 family)